MSPEQFLIDIKETKIDKTHHRVNQPELCQNSATVISEKLTQLQKFKNEISENTSEVEKCLVSLQSKYTRNMLLESELTKLLQEDETRSIIRKMAYEGAKQSCDRLIQNHKTIRHTIMAIQQRLGIKVKIAQTPDDMSCWMIKFCFDKNNFDVDYIFIEFNESNERCCLKDMRPMNDNFMELTHLLEKCNDLSGFLYSYYNRYISKRYLIKQSQ